jgi:hypothetical protein
MNLLLNDGQQRILRSRNIITDQEVVYKVGDLYIAENVLSKTRRQVIVEDMLLEAPRVLRG